MKQIFFTLSLLLLISLASIAQTADPRLQVVYSTEYLQDIAVNHPNELRYLNWYLDNSFKIIELGPEKIAGLPSLNYINPETKNLCGTVESFELENINIFLFAFERKYDRTTTYKFGTTGYAIVFDSEKKVAENYNKYQYGK